MFIDVVIPTYRPDQRFIRLLEGLHAQTMKPDRIVVMNTEEKYYEKLSFENGFAGRFKELEVHHISRYEFDHGGTRNAAAARCRGDILIYLTQDAVPADDTLIEHLVEALLAGEDRAVAYARQLPDEGAGEIERVTRSFNYPEQSMVKGAEQLEELGIKTFFCSNVCAAYRREIFDRLGGFEKHVIFNEDMLYAARAIKKGFRIVYAADARVIHSHNYTCAQQFHRNFDNGVSQAQHPEVFSSFPSEGEGLRMMKYTAGQLVARGKPWLVFTLGVNCLARYLGFFLGKHYDRLSMRLVLRCTANREYWRRE